MSDGTGVHGDNENCRIEVLTAGVLSAVGGFDVEPHPSCAYDFIQIGSEKYCGDVRPNNIAVTAGTTIAWHSDHSVTNDGWEICLVPLGT